MSNLEDIRKYAPTASEAVVARMETTYALALQNADARLIAYSDKSELETVRENFVKGKLGITDSDASIDQVVAAVGDRIDGRKRRLTVYYLLAEHYGKLAVFGG